MINRAEFRSLIIRVICLAAIAYLVLTYGFMITQCHGQNMFPAMKDGDLCIIFRTKLMNMVEEKLSAGDIVAYQIEGERHFGRVVAIPGDTLQIDTGGSITVNGVTENGEILFPTYTRGDLLNIEFIQSGTVYVLGDYRTQTTDSRDYGAIPLAQIEGKVISILRRRGL